MPNVPFWIKILHACRYNSLKKALLEGNIKKIAAVRLSSSPEQRAAHALYIKEHAPAMLIHPTQYQLKGYREATQGSREMEKILANAIEQAVPVLIKARAIGRLKKILTDCEGNKTLEAAIKPEDSQLIKALSLLATPEALAAKPEGLKPPKPPAQKLTIEQINKLYPRKKLKKPTPPKLSVLDFWNPWSQYNVTRRRLENGTQMPISPFAARKDHLILNTLIKSKTPAMLMHRKKCMLPAYRKAVQENAEMEKTLAEAINTTIPKLIKIGAFGRVEQILRDCAGNEILQNAICTEDIRGIAQDFLENKGLSDYERLEKAFRYHAGVQECFDELNKNRKILYYQGRSPEHDLRVMLCSQPGIFEEPIVCEKGNERGTPKQLAKVWNNPNPVLQKVFGGKPRNPSRTAELLSEILKRAANDPGPISQPAKQALQELDSVG